MTQIAPNFISPNAIRLLWMLALVAIAGFTVGLMSLRVLSIVYVQLVEPPDPPEGR